MADYPSQTSSRNPWTKERLLQHIEQPETPYLEFKSSRPLCLDNKDRPRYLDGLAAHAGAFLNAEGGLLLIGLEEGRRRDAPDVATELSPGVPRRQLSAARLESMLCDRIHPSVAGLIKVHSIPIGVTSDEATRRSLWRIRTSGCECLQHSLLAYRWLRNSIWKALTP